MALKVYKNANFHWGLNQPIEKIPRKGGKRGQDEQHKEILKARQGKGAKKKNSGKRAKEEEAETVQNETQTVAELLVLKNLNFSIKKGEFVCLIGDVGSGKSSFLSALLGDLLYLPHEKYQSIHANMIKDDNVKQTINNCHQTQYFYDQSPIVIDGTTSYVQQTPWIQNKTIRDNICFGQPYETRKYDRVIKMCELSRDLEILPAGDMTEIGEKGINLSGGQKARISLARAVYAERDIILMDDPISALDANVKKAIFQNVFVGELKDKTRILVTHAVDFLHLVDRIVLFKEGQIILQGSYEELKSNPYMVKLMGIFKSHKKEQADLIQKTVSEGQGTKAVESKGRNGDE